MMKKKIEEQTKQLHDEFLKRSATYIFEQFMKRIRIKQYIRKREEQGTTFIFKAGTDGQYWLEELKKEE